MRISHCGDIHVEEDRYFGDTAHCLEWFVAHAINSNVDLFVMEGDLTSYKSTRLVTRHCPSAPGNLLPAAFPPATRYCPRDFRRGTRLRVVSTRLKKKAGKRKKSINTCSASGGKWLPNLGKT